MISEEDQKRWDIEGLLNGDGVPVGGFFGLPMATLARRRKEFLYRFRSEIMIEPL